MLYTQTMRTKIQYDWAELPVEAHASLRQSLLAHVLRFGQSPLSRVIAFHCLGLIESASTDSIRQS